eukprot:TRINITY_DN12672_c0_g6_i1.p1 TRINITY_DN12672_c0_g6~~TRINITY_DN12672_c0_g6_i1.p1  ORF type:complete len:347 (+),score=70.58 TRINITY_DN12672_c0_g6_i1:489-1529(+)
MAYGIFQGFGTFIGNGCIIVVLYCGGTFVINGEMSTGDLGSFIMYTLSIGVSSASTTAMLGNVVSSMAACDRVFELIDYAPKINAKGGKTLTELNGEISFKEVEFTYPTKSEVQVLKNFNLDIKKGEVVALVGSSGSGKSSIVGMLQRFYDVQSGAITIDSTNLRDLDLVWFHSNIGYVAQEPSLFSGSIEENIAYGVDKYTREDLDRITRMANAYDFIHNTAQFPEGYRTVVGERGVKLSGGQKQRIAIARALMKQPKILIFDEATSALDAESEYQVQSAIDSIISMSNTTVIIIAHRLSTIINCQRILVLNQGQIVEEGTHSALVAKNGVYRQLIERQLGSINH